METIVFGRTGLQVSRTAFGCLPIQRVSTADAGKLLRRAYEAGITLFDTARAYSDSEEKIGLALADVRDKIVIATKTGARTAEGFWRDLKTSLSLLKTDHIDIYQFHNPPFVPMPGGEDGLYDAALEAQRQGLIGHIGITQHSLARAEEAVASGLYATLQFPLNHLATEREIALARRCEAEGVGFLAMKALSGGLITDATIPFVFLRDFPGVAPIWGFQFPDQLEQLIALSACPPPLDEAMKVRMAQDRETLTGAFCRSCGYCLPCPVGIPIYNANRMTQLITRSPSAQFMTPAWQADMEKINDCIHCGQCEKRCPYDLKPYETMPEHLRFYRAYVLEHGAK
ncbi:MAG: aldo/keto reductase [Oscillospiraceae bacterium]|jgi:aryl-alcohol dehydrogenase-like predicted oxidoreductase|nr:aldo/keto reductase [Oscillospiraceae bacterium]